ncbi:MAG: thioredoxin family protein [Cognaticolwellia sp.]
MRPFSTLLLSAIMMVTVSACANSHGEADAMAIGEISQQQLMASHKVFSQGYQAFQLSPDEMAEMKRWPSDLHVEVYFGTWCHDSQREVPKFLKMLTEKPSLSHRLIALDYQKSEPNGSAKSHDIKFTPTFVIYQNNQEIGRVIERPTVSIAADISAML